MEEIMLSTDSSQVTAAISAQDMREKAMDLFKKRFH